MVNMLDLVESYLLECQARQLSPRTIETYNKLLRPLFLWLGDNHDVQTIEQLTPQHYKMYLLFKEKEGAKPQYINDILRVMRTFSRYLLEEGYVNRLLTEKIRNVRQPKVKIVSFNEKEVREMIGYYSRADFLNVRNKTLLMLFFDTGARCDEVLSMRLDQITPNHILLHGKGKKDRFVPLSPVLRKQIQKYQKVRERYFRNKIAPDILFPSKTGRKLTTEMMNIIIKEAAEEVGVRKTVRASPHTCRHTFAHTQLRNGCDIYTLSRLLGHESVSITQRYLEGIQDEQVLAIGLKYSPLMNLGRTERE